MSIQRIRKPLSILLALALVFVLASSVAAQEDEIVVEPGGSVKIGLAAGLSGEGIAPLGIDIRRGAELALEDRSSVTVEDTEFPVELDVQDAQCNAEGGQSVANRFTSDPNVAGVVGHMCSSSCVAAAPIYDSADYSMVSPSCTSPVLTLRGFTSFNRAVPSDGFQGEIAAQFIYEELEVRSVATIHDGSPYGEGLVQVMGEEFEELGGEVVAADAVNVGDTDFRALLEEIASEEPELIYFGGFPAEGARLIQQRADAGLQDTIFMGADGIQGTEVIELAGDAANGVYASRPIATSSEALDNFLERYVEVYEEEPPAPFHANAYDAYNLLLNAVEETGELDDDGNLVLSREELREYLRSVEDFQGLTGNMSADGTGELFSAEQSVIGIFQVQEGAFTEVMQYGGSAEEDMEEEPMEEDEAESTEEPEGEGE